MSREAIQNFVGAGCGLIALGLVPVVDAVSFIRCGLLAAGLCIVNLGLAHLLEPPRE